MYGQSAPAPRRDRFFWFRALTIAVFAMITARVAYLQVLRSEYFLELAEAQRVRRGALFPARGSVFLADAGSDQEIAVATTRLVPSAYVVPRDISDLKRAAELLAEIVQRYQTRAEQRRQETLVATGQWKQEERDAQREAEEGRPLTDKLSEQDTRRKERINEFLRRFGNPTDPYEPILPGAEELDAEAIAELQSANLPGIAFREVAQRAYPEGTLAAHVLGFVRESGLLMRGEYGIEEGLDGLLRGAAGFRATERDTAGRMISVGDSAFTPVENGADVILTVDRVLQTTAQDIARKGYERFGAERAQVVVMDPNTGGILALAAYPTFDPNAPNAIRDVQTFNNPIVSDLFEPGSVFKPLIMGAALEHGLVEPDTTMQDTGPVHIAPFTINTYDGKHHGTVTMTEVLEQSNNVGMVWVSLKVGAEQLYQFLRRIGVGERTGVSLADEALGQLPLPGTWGDTRTATIGFGQGVVMTPLQALVANAALINGGRLLQPTLIREIRYPDGQNEIVEPKVIRQVVRPEVSTKLRAMLVSVVENGVAQLARVKGYYVGGKTGTAQVADPETGKYSADKKIISFIGFGPADNPAFIAMVKLDNPAGLSLASGTAAPLFSEFAKRAFDYLRIPPVRATASDPLGRQSRSSPR
ncbi:MAG: cell division protein FtsI (penicillin-binding protein 3) [Parcubacteria group bacterium Gr01-1014_106]|nr:MAG: cell division protein FtsI (penicillin-binding protein 3) [Parcubacteria group bacterium Gr01-1014_106]